MLLSTQGLKRVRYPSSVMKRAWIFFSNLDWLATSFATSWKLSAWNQHLLLATWDYLHIFYWNYKFLLFEKSLKLNWFFLLERIFFTKILNQEYFFVYDLSYDLQTYIKQSASHVTITDQFQVKDKSRVFQDKYFISYTHLKNDQ